MTSVWVIEQGEYSDYRVIGVYTTEKGAHKVCDYINRDREYGKATVAEWEMNPGLEAINRDHLQFLVHMAKDGTVELIRSTSDCYDIGANIHMWRRSTAKAYVGSGKCDLMCATVWAKDEKHAVKIVNEKRSEWIALGKWEAA